MKRHGEGRRKRRQGNNAKHTPLPPHPPAMTIISVDEIMQRAQKIHPVLFTDIIDGDTDITLTSPTTQYQYAWEVAQFIFSEYGFSGGSEVDISSLLQRVANDLCTAMAGRRGNDDDDDDDGDGGDMMRLGIGDGATLGKGQGQWSEKGGIRRDMLSYCVEYIVLMLISMARGEDMHMAMSAGASDERQHKPSNDVVSRMFPRRRLYAQEMLFLVQSLLTVCRASRHKSIFSISVCSFYELYASFANILETCIQELQFSGGQVSSHVEELVHCVGELAGEVFESRTGKYLQGFDRIMDVEAAIKCLHDVHDGAIRSLVRATPKCLSAARSIIESIWNSCLKILDAAHMIISRFASSLNSDCLYAMGIMHISIPVMKLEHSNNELDDIVSQESTTANNNRNWIKRWQPLLKSCYMSSDLVVRFIQGWYHRIVRLGNTELLSSDERHAKESNASASSKGDARPALWKRFLMEVINEKKGLYDIYDMLLYLMQSDYADMVVSLLCIIGDAFIAQCDRRLGAGRGDGNASDRDVIKARCDFFLQALEFIAIGFRRKFLSPVLYLRMVSVILERIHRHHSYDQSSTRTLAFFMFEEIAQEAIGGLLLLVDNMGGIADVERFELLVNLLTHLAVLEFRVVLPRLSSLWQVFFQVDYSRVADISALERCIGALLKTVFTAYASGSVQEQKPFDAYFQGLHQFLNHCLVYYVSTDWYKCSLSAVQFKPIRDAIKEFIQSIPSTNLLSCLQDLVSGTKKNAELHAKLGSSSELRRVAYKLTPLMLLPLTLFGFHALIYENCYADLRDATIEICMPLVGQLLSGYRTKDNADQHVAAMLQLYYAMRGLHNRAEEFSSDVYLLKPLRSSSSSETGEPQKKKRRKPDQDFLLDFGNGDGWTLDHLLTSQIVYPRSRNGLSSTCMLFYIVMQRMYELNQQLMIQRHSLIYTHASGEGAYQAGGATSAQFQLQFGFYTRYFEFVMSEFTRLVSQSGSKQVNLSNVEWDGLVESVAGEQQMTVMLWKLITANFSHILPNLDQDGLEIIIKFAIENAKPEHLTRSVDVYADHGDVDIHTRGRYVDTIESITGRFIEEEQILDLEEARPYVIRAIFSSLEKEILALLPSEGKLRDDGKSLLGACKHVLSGNSDDERHPYRLLDSVIATITGEGSVTRKILGQKYRDSVRKERVHMPLLGHLPITFYDDKDAYVLFCAVQLLNLLYNLYQEGSGEQMLQENLRFKLILRRLASAMSDTRAMISQTNLLMQHLRELDQISATVCKTVDDSSSSNGVMSKILELTLDVHVIMIRGLPVDDIVPTIQPIVVDMVQVLVGQREDISHTAAVACLNMLYGVIDAQRRDRMTIKKTSLVNLLSTAIDDRGTTVLAGEMQYIAQQVAHRKPDSTMGWSCNLLAAHITEVLSVLRVLCSGFKDLTVLSEFGLEQSEVEDQVVTALDHVARRYLCRLVNTLDVNAGDDSEWNLICRTLIRLTRLTTVKMDILADDAFPSLLAERLHVIYREIAKLCVHFSRATDNAEHGIVTWRKNLASVFMSIVSPKAFDRQRFFMLSYLLGQIETSIHSSRVHLAGWVKKLIDPDGSMRSDGDHLTLEDDILGSVLHMSSLVGALQRFSESQSSLLLRTFFDTVALRLYETTQQYAHVLSMVTDRRRYYPRGRSTRRLVHELCVLLEKVVRVAELALYSLRTGPARYTNIDLLGTACTVIASTLASVRIRTPALPKLVVTMCNFIRANSKQQLYTPGSAPQVVPTVQDLTYVLFNMILVEEVDHLVGKRHVDSKGSTTVVDANAAAAVTDEGDELTTIAENQHWTHVTTVAPVFVVETVAQLYATLASDRSCVQHVDTLVMGLVECVESGIGAQYKRIRGNVWVQKFHALRQQTLDAMFDRGLVRLFFSLSEEMRTRLVQKLEGTGQVAQLQLLHRCLDRAAAVRKDSGVKKYEAAAVAQMQ